MSTTRDNTKKRRPSQTGELIGVRLQPEQLAALDGWRARQDPVPSRPEAIRLILGEKLS
jgi:hypothetical protein